MNRKRFSTLYIIFTGVAFLAVIFPIYEIANRSTPLVFGLPFSFFWVIVWVLIAFTAVLVLYFVDPDHKKNGEE